MLTPCLTEQVRAEIRQDRADLNAFVEAHASFADMVREHYATVDGKCIDRLANPFQRS